MTPLLLCLSNPAGLRGFVLGAAKYLLSLTQSSTEFRGGKSLAPRSGRIPGRNADPTSAISPLVDPG